MNKRKRLVIKLGSSVLTGGASQLSPRRMLEIVRQVAQLSELGNELILVTSGAMAAGRGVLQNPALGSHIPAKQMLAAIGQPRLMHAYADLFAIYDLQVAQILLTNRDLRSRRGYLNARDTLDALLGQLIIPIVNENDTVATEEIRLGDNDNLSALVANLVDADLLIMLTDQPGLFTTDPRSDPNAQLINHVEEIDDALWEIAGGAGSDVGTGGMVTKLQAAQLATRSGTGVVIAQGSRPDVLIDLLGAAGHTIGTWFEPTSTHIESRKRWLLSDEAQGTIQIDAGAVKALKRQNVSLLPVGVVQVKGTFERGMVVQVAGPDGSEIARGVANYKAGDLEQICGLRSSQIEERLGYTYGDEVIHRDHLVVV
jgi:glutamate 5-kinase